MRKHEVLITLQVDCVWVYICIYRYIIYIICKVKTTILKKFISINIYNSGLAFSGVISFSYKINVVKEQKVYKMTE